MTGVVVIDHGAGNYASVAYAIDRLGVACTHTSDPARIREASHVILPGVGAAGAAMRHLADSGLAALLPTLTQPVLGICLGMQILHEASAEDDTECLRILPGRAERLSTGPGLRRPHMGWNTIDVLPGNSPLLDGLDAHTYVYFVHSYAVPLGPGAVASATYGTTFTAVETWRNFHGVQFHPERSGPAGARLLANFLSL